LTHASAYIQPFKDEEADPLVLAQSQLVKTALEMPLPHEVKSNTLALNTDL
jgi:hypothetical protein